MTARPPTRPWPASDKVVPIDVYIPRIHVASIETCGCIADFDPVRGHLDFHVTSQAPHVYRTVISLVSGIPESNDPGQDPRHRRRLRRQGARSTRATSARSSPR